MARSNLKDIAHYVHRGHNEVSRTKVEEILTDAFQVILEFASMGDKVKISKFGTFKASFFKGRTLMTPLMEGGSIDFKDQLVLRFKQASKAKKIINELGKKANRFGEIPLETEEEVKPKEEVKQEEKVKPKEKAKAKTKTKTKAKAKAKTKGKTKIATKKSKKKGKEQDKSNGERTEEVEEIVEEQIQLGDNDGVSLEEQMMTEGVSLGDEAVLNNSL